MNTADIKKTISRSYPLNMKYEKAGRLQIKRGKHRRSFARTVGYSEDRLLSVELVGKSKQLEHAEFMISTHDPAKTAVAIMAAVAVIREAHPTWDDDDEAWLMQQVQNQANGTRGPIRTSAQLIQAQRPFTVVFIKVKG